MKRYANIDDIFDAIYFFANSSPYITGQVLHITGGMEL
jgi:NAD(P)-dependent dehydrogenase (short-subunit alcohol dehydrogenase family)